MSKVEVIQSINPLVQAISGHSSQMKYCSETWVTTGVRVMAVMSPADRGGGSWVGVGRGMRTGLIVGTN